MEPQNSLGWKRLLEMLYVIPLLPNRLRQNRFPRAVLSQILNISKAGDSTTSSLYLVFSRDFYFTHIAPYKNFSCLSTYSELNS